MKNLRSNSLYLIVFSLILILGSCKPKINEIVESTYPDGKKKTTAIYKDSASVKVKVQEMTYHENGNVKMKGNIDNNQRNGLWYSWYDDGTKWSETSFLNGKKDGPTKTWYPNGKMRYQGFYSNDKESGLWSFWDENGNHIKDVDFSNSTSKSIN